MTTDYPVDEALAEPPAMKHNCRDATKRHRLD